MSSALLFHQSSYHFRNELTKGEGCQGRGRPPPIRPDFFHFDAAFGKELAKQVCIPLGCIPPTCCPYLPACTAWGCLLPWGVCFPGGVSASWGAGLLPKGVSASQEGCLFPGVSALDGCVSQHALRQTSPP